MRGFNLNIASKPKKTHIHTLYTHMHSSDALSPSQLVVRGDKNCLKLRRQNIFFAIYSTGEEHHS